MRGISWLAANQLASQEGLCTMKLVLELIDNIGRSALCINATCDSGTIYTKEGGSTSLWNVITTLCPVFLQKAVKTNFFPIYSVRNLGEGWGVWPFFSLQNILIFCHEKEGKIFFQFVVTSIKFHAFTAQNIIIIIYFQTTKSLIGTKQHITLPTDCSKWIIPDSDNYISSIGLRVFWSLCYVCGLPRLI